MGKISSYSAASALGGTETLLGNQSSTTKLITPAQIETYIAGLGRTFAKDAGLWWPLAASAIAVNGPADTSENTLATITVPAGAMGGNGILRIWTLWTLTNNANAKTLRVRFSGASGTQFALPSTPSASGVSIVTQIANRNSQSSQVGSPNASSSGFGTSSASPTTAAVDTSAATTVVITCQKATAGDTITLESYAVELLYKA